MSGSDLPTDGCCVFGLSYTDKEQGTTTSSSSASTTTTSTCCCTEQLLCYFMLWRGQPSYQEQFSQPSLSEKALPLYTLQPK